MTKKAASGKKHTYILSVGGSLIVPDEINLNFLKKFRALVLGKIKAGNKFVIVCGGGSVARRYQKAIRFLENFTLEDLDWIGIYATFLNALLVKTALSPMCHWQVLSNPHEKRKLDLFKPILVAGGYRPGWSTDFDAVTFAVTYGARTVINLSNIDYVYTKDPKKFKDAKPIEKISWSDFQKIVGTEWKPGINVPFDPVAAKLAKKQKIRVIILNGGNLKNLDNCLEGRKFIGTVIK